MSAILAGLAPDSGTMLSTSSTSQPSRTRRRAKAEPISPTPPVISTRASRNCWNRISEAETTMHRLYPPAKAGGRQHLLGLTGLVARRNGRFDERVDAPRHRLGPRTTG